MLVKLGNRYDDVVANSVIAVNGTVIVPVGVESLEIGTLLTSIDGGLTWDILQEDQWEAGEFATGETVYHLGHIWESKADANTVEPGTDDTKWTDKGLWNANGVLVDRLETTGASAVLVCGTVVESNLIGFEDALRAKLFDNKIITK